MGTGAVYLTLSGIHNHPSWLTTVETVFYSLSIVIFAFNVLMLSLQVTCASSLLHSFLSPTPFEVYPSRTWRLIKHPVEGTFIPLMVRICDVSYSLRLTNLLGVMPSHHHHRYHQLRPFESSAQLHSILVHRLSASASYASHVPQGIRSTLPRDLFPNAYDLVRPTS